MDFATKFNNIPMTPEQKLVNFLKISADILISDVLWDIDVLSINIKSDLAQTSLPLDNARNSVILNNDQTKTLFLNVENMKLCLEMCVKSLLDFILETIKTFEKQHFTMLVDFVEKISRFLSACEKSNTILNVDSNVIMLLDNLLSIMRKIELEFVIEKGPANSTILKMLSAFKEVTIARDFLLKNILFYCKELIKSKVKNTVGKFMNENFLLHLMLLKEILQYIMNNNLKLLARTRHLFENLIEVLKVMNNYAPEFIKMVIADCINLMT